MFSCKVWQFHLLSPHITLTHAANTHRHTHTHTHTPPWPTGLCNQVMDLSTDEVLHVEAVMTNHSSESLSEHSPHPPPPTHTHTHTHTSLCIRERPKKTDGSSPTRQQTTIQSNDAASQPERRGAVCWFQHQGQWQAGRRRGFNHRKAHTNTHTHALTHARTHTHTHARTHTHMHAHTDTRTQTHTHKHTHTHTHIQSQVLFTGFMDTSVPCYKAVIKLFYIRRLLKGRIYNRRLVVVFSVKHWYQQLLFLLTNLTKCFTSSSIMMTAVAQVLMKKHLSNGFRVTSIQGIFPTPVSEHTHTHFSRSHVSARLRSCCDGQSLLSVVGSRSKMLPHFRGSRAIIFILLGEVFLWPDARYANHRISVIQSQLHISPIPTHVFVSPAVLLRMVLGTMSCVRGWPAAGGHTGGDVHCDILTYTF